MNAETLGSILSIYEISKWHTLPSTRPHLLIVPIPLEAISFQTTTERMMCVPGECISADTGVLQLVSGGLRTTSGRRQFIFFILFEIWDRVSLIWFFKYQSKFWEFCCVCSPAPDKDIEGYDTESGLLCVQKSLNQAIRLGWRLLNHWAMYF